MVFLMLKVVIARGRIPNKGGDLAAQK